MNKENVVIDFDKIKKLQSFQTLDELSAYCRANGYLQATFDLVHNGIEAVAEYLKNGGDIDYADPMICYGDGRTLMHEAANSNDVDMLKFLLDHHAKIDPVSFGGQTPLYEACHYNRVEAAKYLIERGADVFFRNPDGYSLYRTTKPELIEILKSKNVPL